MQLQFCMDAKTGLCNEEEHKSRILREDMLNCGNTEQETAEKQFPMNIFIFVRNSLKYSLQT